MHSVLQVLPTELSVLGVLGLKQHYPLSPVGLVEGTPGADATLPSGTSSWVLC